MNTRNIRVQGRGSVSQEPDRVQIVFRISHQEKEFAETVEGCNERTDAIRHAIVEVGLRKSELKTMTFNICEEQEYRGGKHVHVGFVATHQAVLELPIDKPLIGRLLSEVIRGKGKPTVNLIFTVSDPESLKQKVLADAVANARRRAETIAQAASLKLGSIEHIEYGYSEVRISSEPCHMALQSVCDAGAPGVPELEPNKIASEDNVTIIWNLVE